MTTRTKYDKSIEPTKVFKRQLIRGSEGDLIKKIREYDEHVSNASVCYFVCNPRSIKNTYRDGIAKVIKEYNSCFDQVVDSTIGKPKDIHSLVLSCFQTSHPIKKFKEIDIDTKNEDVLKKLESIFKRIDMRIAACVETKGGYHVIYVNRLTKTQETDLYVFIQQFKYESIDRNGKFLEKNYVEIRSDPCTPIPGTIQAGFNVVLSNRFPSNCC